MTATLNGHDLSGSTAQRPVNAEAGQPFFDMTLGQLLAWNGSTWVTGSSKLRDITIPVVPRLYNKTWYVSADGKDSNSGQSSTAPFLTIGKAMSVASGRVLQGDLTTYTSGDLIIVLNGDYNLGALQLICKDGVDLIGQSRDGVVIHGTFPLASGAIVKAPASATLENLTIIADSSTITPQCPLGACHLDAVFTNFIGRNLRLVGNSDCFKVEPAGTYSAKMYSCLLQSRFDCWNDNSRSASVDWFDCELFALGYSGSSFARCVEQDGAGTSRMFRCRLYAYSDDTQPISTLIGAAANAGKLYLYDCDIVVSNHAEGLDLATSLSQSSTGVLGVFNTTYDSTLTSGTITTAPIPSGIQSNSPSLGVGYATGAGSTGTQSTNKTTTVVLSPTPATCGTVTTNNAGLNAATIVSFDVTDAAVATTDLIVINHISGGTLGAYTVNARAGNGKFTVDLRNNTAGTLSEALVLAFAVIKGVTS